MSIVDFLITSPTAGSNLLLLLIAPDLRTKILRTTLVVSKHATDTTSEIVYNQIGRWTVAKKQRPIWYNSYLVYIP